MLSFHLPFIFHLSQKLRRRFTIFRVHLHRCRCQKWCQYLIFDFGQDMKFYLLFRVNFLYSKVVFLKIRVNLCRVNFQYLNSVMERSFPINKVGVINHWLLRKIDKKVSNNLFFNMNPLDAYFINQFHNPGKSTFVNAREKRAAMSFQRIHRARSCEKSRELAPWF